MDSSRLSERIAVPATGDEIQQLAETVNGMLARIEHSFQRIRQFTANASHELRTPLAIIRTNAEVALLDHQDRSGRSAREALRRILKEAERNSTLLDDMLQLARSGTVVEHTAQKPIDLGAVLRTTCSDVRPLAAARGLNLTVLRESPACMTEGDEEQIRRLWLILLDNAVKYTPTGGAITASTGVTDHGCPFGVVADTGIGIEPDQQANIFEPFYRVDKARSRSQGGSGLGLAIARRIAASHDAEIAVESALGCGSRFVVTFPSCKPVPVNSVDRREKIFR
jgi:signal transduction histidine kinase